MIKYEVYKLYSIIFKLNIINFIREVLIMVDRQHRPGGKTGSGGVASYEDANVERRERLKKLVR